MNRIATACVLVCCLVLALVAPAGAETLESLFSPPECGTGAPDFQWRTGGCNASFCLYEEQCWAQCSEAIAVACVNGVCQYTLPGGGGGGNNCNQSFCSTNEQCTCQDGTLRQCVNNVCV